MILTRAIFCGYIVELIPRAVLAPILVFVAFDIMCQAFLACPANQIPYQFTTAYLALAVIVFALSFTKQSQEPTFAAGITH
jgi:hypothetical protein